MISKSIDQRIRNGCKDVWNAFMVDGAEFVLASDIPICPCVLKEIPKNLISFVKAKQIHKHNKKTNPDYHVDAFVHFYFDDYKFEGKRTGIWFYPNEALEIISHFTGVISPDFSTYVDFPDSILRFYTYRMRAFGRWLTTHGIAVINNVRWGTEETWSYCFDGIPYNSIVAIGTVGSGLRTRTNLLDFEPGFYKMIEVLNPHTIIVYGSANYECFKIANEKGIEIVQFPSETNLAFASMKEGKSHE